MLGTLILALNFAITAAAASLFSFTFPFRKWQKIRYLYVTNAAFLILAFCTTAVLIQNSLPEKILFSRFRFVGIALLAPSYLIFASHALNRMRWIQHRFVKVLLYAPGLATIAAILVPPWREIFVFDYQPFHYEGLSVLTFKGGGWFFFHVAAGYLEGLLFAIVCALAVIQERGRLRQQAFALLAAIVVTSAFDLFCFFTASPLRWVMLSTSLYGLNQFALLYSASALGLANARDLAKEKIFDRVPYPVIAVDSRGRLAGANAAAQAVFEIGDHQIASPLESFMSKTKRAPGEIELTGPTGETSYFHLSVIPLMVDKSFVGEIYSYKEITNEKKNVDELVHLLSVVSHDLAGTIQYHAQLADLVSQKLPANETSLANALVESSAANRDLIHSLVTWSKSQREDVGRKSRPFELNALISDTLEITHPLCSAKNLRVNVQIAPPILILGNSGMISSVLRNFISNAVRASDVGQTIEVTLERKEASVIVTVIDQGRGLNASESLKADGSHGYGIGLKLGRRFIEQHRGELVLEPNPSGIGSRAWFSLPTS